MFLFAIALFLFVSIGIFSWFYLFNIYEVKIAVTPNQFVLAPNSEIEIKVIPLNSFGAKAFMRNISADFEIAEGKKLVEISEQTLDRIILKSIGELGRVEVLVTPQYGMFPSKLKFDIVEKGSE
jgi:hypothetical protein